MKSKFLMALLVVIGFVVSPAFADHLMDACKKECPDAKDKNAMMECIKNHETGPGAVEFKKSACHAAHEKHHHGGTHHDGDKKD